MHLLVSVYGNRGTTTIFVTHWKIARVLFIQLEDYVRETWDIEE